MEILRNRMENRLFKTLEDWNDCLKQHAPYFHNKHRP